MDDLTSRQAVLVAVDDFCHSADYIDLDYEPNFCPNCGAKMEVTE